MRIQKADDHAEHRMNTAARAPGRARQLGCLRPITVNPTPSSTLQRSPAFLPKPESVLTSTIRVANFACGEASSKCAAGPRPEP